VGTVLFICLNGDDVAYQDAGAFVPGPAPLLPAETTGAAPVPAGSSRYVRGYSGGTQTMWLEATLASARADASVDWIIVQLHQCACSSSRSDGGSDLGVREEWLPLFDRYEVDLVLSGHDHGYERSFPVRGFDAEAGTEAVSGAPVDTRRPRPVTTVDSGVFDTSQGTVHLVLGSGGRAGAPVPHAALARVPWAGSGKSGTARVFTRPSRPVAHGTGGRYVRPAADAVEAADWSARRDTASEYGIAVFDVNPGTDAGGQTSITAWYYHVAAGDRAHPTAGGPGPGTAAGTGDYSLFETFTLVRPRSTGRRWYRKR
jgi:3',5'-cyclic AMP phosphodiesterase CpdA